MKKEEIENKIKSIQISLDGLKTSDLYVCVKRFKKELKQLKQQLKDLPSLEVGRWYKNWNCNLLYYITEINGAWIVGYGFERGKWITPEETNNKEDCWFDLSEDKLEWAIPATEKEVEEALIKEAKKRYNDNDLVCSVYDKGYSGNIKLDTISVNKDNTEVWVKSSGYNVQLMEQGKWAEIIQTKTVELNGNYTEVQLKDILNSQF